MDILANGADKGAFFNETVFPEVSLDNVGGWILAIVRLHAGSDKVDPL